MIDVLVEKMRRPGLLGLAGKKIEKRCKADLSSYFTHLGRSIRGLKLEQCVEYGTKEVALHAVRLKLDNTLRLHRPMLKAVLTVNLMEARIAGKKQHVFAEADSQDDPIEDPNALGLTFDQMINDIVNDEIEDVIDMVGESAREAAEWAEDYAGLRIEGIDENTRELIARAIAVGIADQLGPLGTAKLIEGVVKDMPAWRAEMIAITEMSYAMSAAALDKLQEEGIGWKRWITSPGACPICQANRDQGAIELDEAFESGVQNPPAHPNCRCALVGARRPEEDDEED